MKLAVFGAGYVGLVTGACFAELGNEVLVYDIDERKTDALRGGKVPFYEPGLEDMVRRNVAAGRLRFTADAAEAAGFGEVTFIAVGTPSLPDGNPDLKYVQAAVATIGENMSPSGTIVVMKSTVPPGTTARMRTVLKEVLAAPTKFAVVSNPEFLKEGDAIRDFMKPDRIVVGVEEEWAREKMEELYVPLAKNGHPILFMDPVSSEMSKYAANALLATKISFMNQIAGLCEAFGADVEEVRQAIAADSRIGPHFLYPGVGYGGSCFPKDVQALAAMARAQGQGAEILEAVERVNETQKTRLVDRAAAAMGGLSGKSIAVWGLAFKPNTDDMRQAPSIAIIEKLLAAGASITAYDPVAMTMAQGVLGDRIDYAKDMYGCLCDADALFLVTEWAEFREPDFEKVADLMRAKNIFDGRNIYDSSKLRELGFEYIGIGRK
jgi:UDPglucose 6-dehydrogenase